MNIKSMLRFQVALLRGDEEQYATWAVPHVGQISDQIEGVYQVEVSLPDGRQGQFVAHAPSKHSARDKARDLVARVRLADDYGVDLSDWINRQVAFLVEEPDLRALGA